MVYPTLPVVLPTTRPGRLPLTTAPNSFRLWLRIYQGMRQKIEDFPRQLGISYLKLSRLLRLDAI